jgi:hypothetical protein
MKFAKWIAMGSGGVILAVASVILVSPKAAHALAAAMVQITNTTANPVPTAPAVPGNPYFGNMEVTGYAASSVGPGTGTLGVTQIVVTNLGANVAQVNIYEGLLSGGTCGGNGNVEAATNPFLIVKVQPNSTLVIPAPTPLVFYGATGYDNVAHTCVAASMPITGGDVFVTVNGFVN